MCSRRVDPVEPLGHVPLPDRLAELSVVDDVDAGVGLLPYDVDDRRAQRRFVGVSDQRRLCLSRALESPDVGGQDPVDAVSAHATALAPVSCFDARRAPSTSASSLAHWIVGWTRAMKAPCANPQSVPPMTLSGPTTLASRTSR